ncbi:Clp1/GlmU family protein [Inquilinus limosus]|uniref:Clp1/GlmU family protein n=1 Tax=Inquilinus limosus TaxID=171674 RepID=UPI003F5CE761
MSGDQNGESRPVLDIPDDWSRALHAILAGGIRRIVVIGAADVGKSSFCRALLAQALRRRRSTALVDADVGQKTVGPPAAVTLCHEDDPAKTAALAFVGTTNPVHGFAQVVTGTRRLVDEAEADLVAVNTSGLLSGVGQRLKAAKLAAVRPDLVVALGSGRHLDALIAQEEDRPVLRLLPSPDARRKTRSQREQARRNAFRRYFEGSSVWRLSTDSLAGIGPRDLPPRLLVGVSDEAGRDIALAILIEVQPAERRLRLFGPDAQATASRVLPGKLRLDEIFRELPMPHEPGPDRREAGCLKRDETGGAGRRLSRQRRIPSTRCGSLLKPSGRSSGSSSSSGRSW